MIEGSWGRWAVEVKIGPFDARDLRGLLEFARRFPGYRPLVVCAKAHVTAARPAGIEAITWEQFLLSGPPGASPSL